MHLSSLRYEYEYRTVERGFRPAITYAYLSISTHGVVTVFSKLHLAWYLISNQITEDVLLSGCFDIVKGKVFQTTNSYATQDRVSLKSA